MITLKNVYKSFNGTLAVNNLSLEVKRGEIYGILGPNGAGKTTTINMILGFLQVDDGQILVDRIDITRNAAKARNEIGFIPENVRLYPYLSGLENLDYFCSLSGKQYTYQQLSDFLERCGLPKQDHKKRCESYSKGMLQKVGIAIALSKKAKVYILDEPASGLDPLASNELSGLLKLLATEQATVFMASHDIFRVKETCHRIGILKNGVLKKEIISNDVTINELEEIYLQCMLDE